MSNRTDIVVETDNAEGQVLLSASRVYDLTEDKTQDTINSEVKNTLNQLDQNMAYVESGNTASRPYTGGEFISWKGTLYTANGSISSGQSFSAGTGGNLDSVAGNTALGGGLNALNNQIHNLIHTQTISDTTDGYGDARVITTSTGTPIAFRITGGAMPKTAARIFLQDNAGTRWYVKFISDTNLSNIGSTTVEGTLYYLSL